MINNIAIPITMLRSLAWPIYAFRASSVEKRKNLVEPTKIGSDDSQTGLI